MHSATPKSKYGCTSVRSALTRGGHSPARCEHRGLRALDRHVHVVDGLPRFQVPREQLIHREGAN